MPTGPAVCLTGTKRNRNNFWARPFITEHWCQCFFKEQHFWQNFQSQQCMGDRKQVPDGSKPCVCSTGSESIQIYQAWSSRKALGAVVNRRTRQRHTEDYTWAKGAGFEFVFQVFLWPCPTGWLAREIATAGCRRGCRLKHGPLHQPVQKITQEKVEESHHHFQHSLVRVQGSVVLWETPH